MLPLLLIGCSSLTGEEIARLQINKISTNGNITAKEAILDLNAGDDIVFWSDMDVAYEGKVEFRFKLKIFKDEDKISELEIDPTQKNITLGEMKSSIMDKTKWSFTGKNSELKIKEDGTYRISAVFIASNNPSLKINKAELAIKK